MPARIAASALRATADGPVQGYIPVTDTVNGERVTHLIPWNKAARQHSKARGETHDRWSLPRAKDVDVTEQIIATLPPDVHIAHRERYQMLCRKLLADRMALGHWPASVEAELRAIGWRAGKPTLLQEVEELASRYIVEAANRQREADGHRVAADHNARYSA